MGRRRSLCRRENWQKPSGVRGNASAAKADITIAACQGVVECATEVVDDVSADHGRLIYNGFVLFNRCGTLSGLCVCPNDVGERRCFAEKFVKLLEVFRGPINLEQCAICHGEG